MSNIEKALEFYLRGFDSKYIKRRTGIAGSVVKKEHPEIDKPTIMKHQVSYIRDHYDKDEIEAQLRAALSFPNMIRQVRSRTMHLLGCGFGPYSKVFSELLGVDYFNQIEKECEVIRNNTPELSPREMRRLTMLNRYGCEGPNGDPEIAGRMLSTLRDTNQQRYGVDYAMQRKEVADLGTKRRQETMTQKYGAPNSVQIPEIRNKILEKRAEHGNLTSSDHEKVLYELLVECFGVEDVLRNHKDGVRYPYFVDFYIPSRDLFIELNADRSHGTHWYDETDEKDRERKQWMLDKAVELDEKRKPSDKTHKSRYWNYVRVWTELDVEKRRCASKHGLNYLVFWDSKKVMRNSIFIPRLKDVHEWLDAGCPDSKDWNEINTW